MTISLAFLAPSLVKAAAGCHAGSASSACSTRRSPQLPVKGQALDRSLGRVAELVDMLSREPNETGSLKTVAPVGRTCRRPGIWLCIFEFGIAVEVFGLPRPEFDFPWYRFAVVAAEGRRARATGGIVIEADACQIFSMGRLKPA
jgi:hypothetical protein